jgi:hypothetical protein
MFERFSQKVLPVVAGWASGSVVTWMVMDNKRHQEQRQLKEVGQQFVTEFIKEINTPKK